MNYAPFHLTRMGRCYYEQTLPELVRQLTRFNDLLERLAPERNEDNQNPPEEETP